MGTEKSKPRKEELRDLINAMNDRMRFCEDDEEYRRLDKRLMGWLDELHGLEKGDRVTIPAQEVRTFKATPEKVCPACHKQFKSGEKSTLIALGPGDSEEAQRQCREGRPYNAVAVEVHWTCATGLP